MKVFFTQERYMT